MIWRRIVDADNWIVLKAYEAKIDKLERKRLRLAEKGLQTVLATGRLGRLSNPHSIFWQTPEVFTKMAVWHPKEQCFD